MTTMLATPVRLETECATPMCNQFASPLFEQMASGKYDVCATFDLPDDLAEWLNEHRTARKRRGRAQARGYFAGPLAKESYADDIHEINTSKAVRQGRPMSAGYLESHTYSPLPFYPCARHALRITGVWLPIVDSRPKLVAYLEMYRAGELALVSKILGHGAHEKYEVMYLLFAKALEREIGHGPGVVVYNRWDSGQDGGLQFFKERLGFQETLVEWLP